MEPNHLTVSQTNRNKPDLFGKLVLWNRPWGVRSQKTHKLIHDLLSVWTKEIKAIIFFSIASYRIALCWIESHCIVIGIVLYRIASCFICIFNVSYRWLCIEMRIASASVMGMHISNTHTKIALTLPWHLSVLISGIF